MDGCFKRKSGIDRTMWINYATLEGRESIRDWLFKKKYWHYGYATEAANFCKNYAFQYFKVKEVCSMIRDNNKASIRVALRNGTKETVG